VRILVIGGTQFVGRHIVAESLRRGHHVTLFNRGMSDPTLFPFATTLRGDRDRDLSALAEGSWDATIDVTAYAPAQVRLLLQALSGRSGSYVLVSTVSVYATDRLEPGYDEDAPLRAPAFDGPLDASSYGALKVGCEQAAKSGASMPLIVRMGYLAGPNDRTGRFDHWVRKVVAGVPFRGPNPNQPLQCMDVRDAAAFLVARVEHGSSGVMNVTSPGPPPNFREVLDQIAMARKVSLPAVSWGCGDVSLPLALRRCDWVRMACGPYRAVAEGLVCRDLGATARDIPATCDGSDSSPREPGGTVWGAPG
jgi:2'-hydroxyisoflavone reductase